MKTSFSFFFHALTFTIVLCGLQEVFGDSEPKENIPADWTGNATHGPKGHKLKLKGKYINGKWMLDAVAATGSGVSKSGGGGNDINNLSYEEDVDDDVYPQPDLKYEKPISPQVKSNVVAPPQTRPNIPNNQIPNNQNSGTSYNPGYVSSYPNQNLNVPYKPNNNNNNYNVPYSQNSQNYNNANQYNPRYNNVNQYSPNYNNANQYKPTYNNANQYNPTYNNANQYGNNQNTNPSRNSYNNAPVYNNNNQNTYRPNATKING